MSAFKLRMRACWLDQDIGAQGNRLSLSVPHPILKPRLSQDLSDSAGTR
jgi:hypothetical protein